MEDAKRFLRYVLPGLASVVHLGLALYLGGVRLAEKKADDLAEISEFGVALGVFLASGALGYLYSIVYHRVHWWFFPPDHRDPAKLIMGTEDEPTTRRAWIAVSVWWWGRVVTDKAVAGVHQRTDSLANFMHGLGTTLCGTVLVLPIWLATVLNPPSAFAVPGGSIAGLLTYPRKTPFFA